MAVTKKVFEYGGIEVTLETGAIARQATGAVMITMGGTVVLVTVVGKEEAVPGQDFFPLTVNYQERVYAAGRIPGGFFKREGRPSEKETLTSRLIDRPIRPLFPDGFKNEVQVIATVMSADPEVDPDIASILGASAALAISGIPFNGPVGAARVGYRDGDFILNPDRAALETSQLDLVVAGTRKAVLMVESEAEMLSEQVMLDAVLFGHQQMQVAIDAIQALADEAGKAKWDWQPPPKDDALMSAIREKALAPLSEAYQIAEKQSRYTRISEIHAEVSETFFEEENEQRTVDKIKNAVSSLEKEIVRENILKGLPRIDGRDTKTVRPISVDVSVLPRAHGSALFTRGETQAIVVTTLGTARDAQLIDSIEGERRDELMLHYNFPPYCVGETGFVGSPKRREIGHGRLAKRGIQAVMPSSEEFPYVVRVVSEITESNGSSSMASVCGSSLSLMDAGVPITAPVAGIAMGLIKEEQGFAVLTDILGDEDHLGDMDFKVAGTADGVTALQMDIKIEGIDREIMQAALDQAKEGRLHILGEMSKVIDQARTDLSDYAPRIITFTINPDRIRDVIGKGGATIRSITETTGATIDIQDDGTVSVASVDSVAGKEARRLIEQYSSDVEVDHIYEGKVSKIVDFGAFVTILPGKDGLLHISQISNERIKDVREKLSEGQTVKVKVLEVDKQGRIRLSMKAMEEGAA